MPTLSTPPLSSEQRTSLAAALEESRRFRREQLARLDARGTQAPPESDAERHVRARLILAARTALADIEAARDRWAEGTYGWCTRCTEPMPYERLEALPHIAWCEACHREMSP